ncbi:hypothetical protein J5U23_02890 [Saccharolobus shibatae B12]|uniref:Uncharacterized protein n=2 Tax=Saccharolobus shibatae TaxID=2286 RepID=A0A8F5GUL9_SACSH|nr:hypothetical protein J5U23_p2890 [Saccharolobus shibatae B12]QXJ30001.1 hypothetical protein J5U23_02890 [Saccharolobus shibatae B12]
MIGIGKSPLANFVIKYCNEYIGKVLYPYPLFFDDKKLLLSSKTGYILYLKKLVKLRNYIKVALWPDYIPYKAAAKIVDLDLLQNIVFVVPVHSLSDIEIGEELQDHGFNIFFGYASDKKYRNYELIDFLKAAKGEKWYLGVSTRKELKETILYNFNGLDVTGFLFGRNEDRKDSRILKKNLEELLRTVSKSQGRQTTLYEFSKLGG